TERRSPRSTAPEDIPGGEVRFERGDHRRRTAVTVRRGTAAVPGGSEFFEESGGRRGEFGADTGADETGAQVGGDDRGPVAAQTRGEVLRIGLRRVGGEGACCGFEGGAGRAGAARRRVAAAAGAGEAPRPEAPGEQPGAEQRRDHDVGREARRAGGRGRGAGVTIAKPEDVIDPRPGGGQSGDVGCGT